MGSGVLRAIAQKLGEAQNRIQRRAQLVADVGQEFALEPVGFVERDVGLGELAELQIQRLVDGAELFVAGFEIGQHRVEGFGELLEFVAGADVGADVQIALADFFGGFLQNADRLENQSSGDDVEHAGCQRAGDHPGQQNEGAVEEQLVFVDL